MDAGIAIARMTVAMARGMAATSHRTINIAPQNRAISPYHFRYSKRYQQRHAKNKAANSSLKKLLSGSYFLTLTVKSVLFPSLA